MIEGGGGAEVEHLKTAHVELDHRSSRLLKEDIPDMGDSDVSFELRETRGCRSWYRRKLFACWISFLERYSRPGIVVPQNLLDGAGGVTLGVGPVRHQRGEVEAGSGGHWIRNGLILGGWSACVGAAGAGGVDESLYRYLSCNHSHGGNL